MGLTCHEKNRNRYGLGAIRVVISCELFANLRHYKVVVVQCCCERCMTICKKYCSVTYLAKTTRAASQVATTVVKIRIEFFFCNDCINFSAICELEIK